MDADVMVDVAVNNGNVNVDVNVKARMLDGLVGWLDARAHPGRVRQRDSHQHGQSNSQPSTWSELTGR